MSRSSGPTPPCLAQTAIDTRRCGHGSSRYSEAVQPRPRLSLLGNRPARPALLRTSSMRSACGHPLDWVALSRRAERVCNVGVPPLLYLLPIVPGAASIVIWAVAAAGGDYGALSGPFSLQTTAVIVAFSAVTAASVIEITKRVTAIRGVFQRGAAAEWLGDDASVELEHQLTARGRTGTRHRFTPFDVPIEQLSARIGFVLTDVASFPWKAPKLALSLTDHGDARRASLLKWFIEDAKLGASEAEEEDHRRFLMDVLESWRESSGEFESSIQAKLDAFQLEATRAWRRYLTWISIGLAVLVGAIVSYILMADGLTMALTIGLCGTIGAFISWLVRDITAGVERWRAHA